jgi:hypothetical protein
MDDRRSAVVLVSVLAFLCVLACTQSDSADASDGADAAVGRACLELWQLDGGAAATFDVSGCQHSIADGRKLAVFNWANRTGRAQAAPYGPDNHVSPGPDTQGQPWSFDIGESRFIVPFDDSPVTWTILGQSAVVTSASHECGQACGHSEMLGPHFVWIDTCIHACGDGMCDQDESCKSCPADCDCGSLVPFVDCVIPLEDGKTLASFGYVNQASAGSALEIGPDNQFLPEKPARGQPAYFDPGEQHSVFQVIYDGPAPTWMLAGKSATVPSDARLCSQECSWCTGGMRCVEDACRGACGDGVCVEGCSTCPDDCACAPPSVCSANWCCDPPYCGRDGGGLECGIKDACGGRVDCGGCPEGHACQFQNNACLPICSL